MLKAWIIAMLLKGKSSTITHNPTLKAEYNDRYGVSVSYTMDMESPEYDYAVESFGKPHSTQYGMATFISNDHADMAFYDSLCKANAKKIKSFYLRQLKR